ncbi:MAG: phosphoribosyltransferase [Muribaculaceae bacterium]|nr:phosphoribosyltransferase [Muribaculaceae bacterium]
MLNDIEVPSLVAPDLSDLPQNCRNEAKDLFAPKKQKAWKEVQQAEARCDFAPNKVRVFFTDPHFGIISLWNKSLYGRTLTDIKADDSMVDFFAVNTSRLIRQFLGDYLNKGDWCIVTSPKRRHKARNFASLISARLAELLDIPFYEDLAECPSRHRVGAVFSLTGEPPKQRNVIVYDDFVTTGSTMLSMRNLLLPLGYNLIFFTSIRNKL